MNSLKDKLNVSRVNGSCKIMEQWLWSLGASLIEQAQQKLLDIFEGTRITTKLWKIVTYVDHTDLLLEKISLVEEQNDRDIWERLVVDDRLKYVAWFQKTICPPIFKQNLVELTWRCKKQDWSYIFKALEPALALRPLSSDVNKAERHTVYKKFMLYDAFCCFACV